MTARHVPRQGHTRNTHGRLVRPSHSHLNLDFPVAGALEVYEQIAIDEAGQVTAGGIAPGAVQIATFAAGIRPVAVVTALPTLPDALYPPLSYAVLTTDSRLYKNIADVWVLGVDGADIVANSITAGQIAAGAVSTSELAVGARLTGELANETGATPGVFIDSTGILIRDGNMTIEDEFGTTVMEAAGFSSSWRDFIINGVYNSKFEGGTGAANVANGRTADMPYWLVTKTGSPVFSGQCGFDPANLSDEAAIQSDFVPVQVGTTYFVPLTLRWTRSVGSDLTFEVETRIGWYDGGGSLHQTDVLNSAFTGAGTLVEAAFSLAPVECPVMVDPADAIRKAKISHYISISAGSTLGTSNVQIVQTGLRVAPPNLGGGAAFPAAAYSGMQFYRTDLGMNFVWDGTRWQCTCPHTQILRNTVAAGDHAYAATTGSMIQAGPIPSRQGGSDIRITRHQAQFFVNGGTALGASHKWVGTFRKNDSAGTLTTVTTINIDSGASSTWREIDTAIGANLGSGFFRWGTTWTKTGTPGDLSIHEEITYRIIAT